MPRYKDSPEVRAAKQERREKLRKVSKNRSVFPNDDSLLKMLYLAQVDITRKWTGRRRDQSEIHSQLEIFFADRLSE